ncbi:TPA: hypothetical protein N0F65_000147 [Lagenidium giganteum]|uniref:Uncharacterized protein n=1 Tax=Lagenidium giganteum TaxID=4803 RepID=A0AAV2YJ14_9STRA|nr:TPA: hypothetical protein N0F65_000147 [Lagenidium giganteum]
MLVSFGGSPLRSERLVSDYGLHELATIQCVPRIHGGCFAFSIILWCIIFVCCFVSVCTCGLSLPVALCLLPLALLLPLCCL